MSTVSITVSGRQAAAAPGAVIICGNSGDTVQFTFDSEWDAYPVRTARFRYTVSGAELYQDMVFDGNSCEIPPLHDITEVAVGVYAGNIRTTTPAYIPCAPCITDGAPQHPDPAPDVYDQLLECLSGMQGGSSAATVTLAANIAASGEAHSIELYYPHFSCDPEYYFDSQVTCTLSDRQYTKKDNLPAIGMIIYTIGYSTPFFISTVESAVAYSVSGYSDAQAVYSVVYDGLTWYYSRIPYAMGGVYNDSEGHLPTYPGTVNYDSGNDRVTPESVLEILQAVHAQKED